MTKLTIISALSTGNKALSPSFSIMLKDHDKLVVKFADKNLIRYLTEANLPFEILPEKAAVAEKLLKTAQSKAVIYATEENPLLINETVKTLSKSHIKVDIILSESPEQSLLSSIKGQPIKSCQFLTASQINQDTIQPGQHVVVSRQLEKVDMSQVINRLLENYPADWEVALLEEKQHLTFRLRWLSLKETSQLPDQELNAIDVMYCPPLKRDQQVKSFSTLQSYIDEVTGPNGDVWIKEQSASSLIKYVQEETGELIEAIEKNDIENWKEELGDVLVQILYQTSIAEKDQHFTFEDVLEEVNRKIRRRHPHVFDGVKATTPEEVDALWQKIKLEEKRLKK